MPFSTPHLILFSCFCHLRLKKSTTAPSKGLGHHKKAAWRAFYGFDHASMNALKILTLYHKKNGTATETYIKQGSFWQDWSPTALRKGSWTPWRSHIMQFLDNSGILEALARYPAIFSLLGHTAMAAEAPDGHMGDPGRVGEVRNGLTGGHVGDHREKSLKANC